MKTNYLFIFRLKICFEKEADFLYRIRAATITTLRCIVDFTLFLRFTGGEFRGGLKKVIQHVNEDQRVYYETRSYQAYHYCVTFHFHLFVFVGNPTSSSPLFRMRSPIIFCGLCLIIRIVSYQWLLLFFVLLSRTLLIVYTKGIT